MTSFAAIIGRKIRLSISDVANDAMFTKNNMVSQKRHKQNRAISYSKSASTIFDRLFAWAPTAMDIFMDIKLEVFFAVSLA